MLRQKIFFNKQICLARGAKRNTNAETNRMEWNAKDDAWTIWCGDTIHRTCDNKRFEYELYMMDLEKIRKMKQTKVTDYLKQNQ